MTKYFLVFLFLSTPLLATNKKALIFGVTGQDGSYLAELLLDKGYDVHGVKRRGSTINTERVDHIYASPQERNRRFFLHYGDLSDTSGIFELLGKIKPDEIYNLGAQSHVKVSFEIPEYTGSVDALGALRILDAMRVLGLNKTRFYQASSSEMYGLVQARPQNETTPFYPRSPYGVAKLYAHWITVNYREAYDLFAVSGILFNHESPRRGETFVTRKITRAVAAIANGLQKTLHLGNLDAVRDWGHAKDYVVGMWLMLQNDKPEDFVIASGETHTVREFVELAFAHIGISIAWRATGAEEVGYDLATGKELVFVDKSYLRPAEVEYLEGDSRKARAKLGWSQSYTFKDLVADMMEHDLLDARTRAQGHGTVVLFDNEGNTHRGAQ